MRQITQIIRLQKGPTKHNFVYAKKIVHKMIVRARVRHACVKGKRVNEAKRWGEEWGRPSGEREQYVQRHGSTEEEEFKKVQ